MKNQASISEQQLKTLLREEKDVADFVPLAKVRERLALLTSLLDDFEAPLSPGDFLLVSKNGKGKSWFPLKKAIVNIGRSKKADLPLHDDNISRFHCLLKKKTKCGKLLIQIQKTELLSTVKNVNKDSSAMVI
jgi:FHA domain-containing protein